METKWIFQFLTGLSLVNLFNGQKQTCCFPPQFQSAVGTYGGVPTGGAPKVYDLEFRLAYDYPNKRWGYWHRFMYVTKDYTEWLYIEDFQKNEVLFVSVKGNFIMPMPEDWIEMREYCLPVDAEFKESHRVGALDESLTYHAYEYDLSFPNNETAHFKSTFLEDCSPVNEMAWFRTNNWDYTSYATFYDLEENLDSWNPFKQYDKYYKSSSTRLDYYPSSDNDAQRPYHETDAIHFMKRLRITK